MTTPHILIVDADILVRTPLAQYLRECGYLVIEAASGEEAKALLTDSATAVDIVLADVAGEDPGGFALAKWIRDLSRGIRVILAGSIAGSVEKAAGLCDEGPALSKPYDHRAVLQQIQRLRANRKDDSV
ncbi:response regulator transcription factor [Paraburkholderia tropica]|uniref:response regulator transcription factor n=1 Tax=Paraburkholderia tropica TaxID=92647 RepID=UPI002AB78703|nr:response regulator [Paraburkholderia tropica]